MAKNIGDVLDGLTGIVDTGLESMIELSGQSGDPDVRLYEKLQPEDFATLSKYLGTNVTFDYIKDMENRRLRKGK